MLRSLSSFILAIHRVKTVNRPCLQFQSVGRYIQSVQSVSEFFPYNFNCFHFRSTDMAEADQNENMNDKSRKLNDLHNINTCNSPKKLSKSSKKNNQESKSVTTNNDDNDSRLSRVCDDSLTSKLKPVKNSTNINTSEIVAADVSCIATSGSGDNAENKNSCKKINNPDKEDEDGAAAGDSSTSSEKPQNDDDLDDDKTKKRHTTLESSKNKLTRSHLKNKIFDEEKEKMLSLSREERRQHYRCKSNYVKLEDIQCWPEYCAEHIKQIDPPMDNHEVFEVNAELNKKMALFKGDITTLEIDAIVNAANESLLGGGGVDGAIHKAAGPSLLAECEALKGCHTGDAKITGGYYLPANYVIHTVGPRGEKPKNLKSCYETCLNLLKSNELKSIAFPCISTGIYGYPNKNACKIALKTIREWLERESYAKEIECIILCLFLPKDVQIYHQYMPVYFPVHEASSAKEGATSSSNASETTVKTKKQKE